MALCSLTHLEASVEDLLDRAGGGDSRLLLEAAADRRLKLLLLLLLLDLNALLGEKKVSFSCSDHIFSLGG